jgi:hypothetical protein
VWLVGLRQTAGRGRRGRVWETGEGNLAATLLFATDKPPAEAAQVSFVAALAVADLLAAYVPASLVSLKWPNDPLLGGLKVSGILVESGARSTGGLWVAVGMGVNLARKPIDSERPATALTTHRAAPPPAPTMLSKSWRMPSNAGPRSGCRWAFPPSPTPGQRAPMAWASAASPVWGPKPWKGSPKAWTATALCGFGCRMAACGASRPATSSSERLPDAAGHRTGQHQHHVRHP